MVQDKKIIGILEKLQIDTGLYLGNGKEGVVFHDNQYIYKIFIYTNLNQESVDFLNTMIANPIKSRFFIQLLELKKIDDIYILKYSYAKNFKRIEHLDKNEAVNFAMDCWKHRIICKNIKLENFLHIKNELTYIDYGRDIVAYDDNLFLNMCARLYIEIAYINFNEDEKKVLKQKTINDFSALEGLQDFINEVFSKIVFSYNTVKKHNNLADSIDVKDNSELASIIIASTQKKYLFKNFSTLNFSTLYDKLLSNDTRIININYHNLQLTNEPISLPQPQYYSIDVIRNIKYNDVSLMIKTCIQESNTIYTQVKHIINQLTTPNSFKDIVVVIDTKTDNFLREYNSAGEYKTLLQEIKRLIDQNIIDYSIELPHDEICITNKKWFNIDNCNQTHTINNAPVTTQLYAFEKIKSKYILQLDSDVLIGRKDYSHSYLDDMIKELKKNKNVISVGFNIPKSNDKFYEYFGFEDGGFVPEVRFALIQRDRLLSLRPLENNLIDSKLELTWHRSLHQKQKLTNTTSIRGGDSKSYFIHPQNFRKECIDVWFTILDRIENGYLTQEQREEYELVGSYYDWTIPKRNEELVIVTLIKDMSYHGFLRCWNSIITQNDTDFGWIIIDDNSKNGLNIFIKYLINNSNLKEKITFIQNRVQQGGMSNTYKAIHYFCNNPNSIICMIDGDDALIGDNIITTTKEIYNKGADVVIGKMYRTDKLYPNYRYIPDFKNPKITGGNVWQHLKTFRKYLFDSIKSWDFKVEVKDNILGEKREWIQYSVDYAIMVPIIEMSENPIFYDRYNYLHQRRLDSTKKMKGIKNYYISKILTNKVYYPSDIIKNNRRNFLPNNDNIEIDILYKCNLKCESCNRSSTQVNSEDYISIKQIDDFIKESIKLDKKWVLINILGGEPTLHPDFLEIVNLILYTYIDSYSKSTKLQITSNGYSDSTKDTLSKLPTHDNLYIDEKSFKILNKIDYFTPFNNAPIDQQKYQDSHDFSDGCWVTSYCGISLNKNGYYPCSIIGSIDRLFNADKGEKNISSISLKNQKILMNEYCRYCGNYNDYAPNFGDFIPRCEKNYYKENIITPSWHKIYNAYKNNKI